MKPKSISGVHEDEGKRTPGLGSVTSSRRLRSSWEETSGEVPEVRKMMALIGEGWICRNTIQTHCEREETMKKKLENKGVKKEFL